VEDIFFDDDDRKPTPERSFRYPLYERFLWLVAVLAGIAALVGYPYIRDFVERDPRRGWAIIGVVGAFLLATIWVSLRAWMSKVIVSHTSLKMKALGQGYQRISWGHVQRVIYKWRPLGHKLIFVGSDGAKVAFRSAVSNYDLLMEFIRQNVPEQVNDQLDDIFGEEEYEEEPGEGEGSDDSDSGPSDENTDAPDDDAGDDLEDSEEPEEQ